MKKRTIRGRLLALLLCALMLVGCLPVTALAAEPQAPAGTEETQPDEEETPEDVGETPADGTDQTPPPDINAILDDGQITASQINALDAEITDGEIPFDYFTFQCDSTQDTTQRT